MPPAKQPAYDVTLSEPPAPPPAPDDGDDEQTTTSKDRVPECALEGCKRPAVQTYTMTRTLERLEALPNAQGATQLRKIPQRLTYRLCQPCSMSPWKQNVARKQAEARGGWEELTR